MSSATSTATLTSGQASREGPLPSLLLALTMVTGLVDAISYLKLGHVFVANMTGNVVFLGFAIADAKEFSVAASLTATVAFFIGAVAGGRLGYRAGKHRGRFLATAVLMEVAIVALALVVSVLSADFRSELSRYSLIVLLALAMGLQNAVARKLGIPDLTTTVLTLTLTGLAADSALAGGKSPRTARRLLAAASMFVGAALGAVVLFHFGVGVVLGVVFALLGASAIAAYRQADSTEPWTAGG